MAKLKINRLTEDEIAQYVAPIETRIKYTFHNKSLLYLALIHRSFVFETPGANSQTNERLEFLGDAVLAYVSASYLYNTFPDQDEGTLTLVRAKLVNADSLAKYAKEIQLGSSLLLGKGEESSGGRERDIILADALEAIIGAITLDGGVEQSTSFIVQFIQNDAQNSIQTKNFKDDKSLLQERIQSKIGKTPVYEVVGESGPDHHKQFKVEVRLNNITIGCGEGPSKQKAQQAAAHDALHNGGWLEQ